MVPMNSSKRKAGPPSNQQSISSFFSQKPSPSKSKRGGSPIDLTEGDIETPPTKKLRTQSSVSGNPVKKAGVGIATKANRWRLDSPERPQSSVAQKKARMKIREQFKKKLLGDSNLFYRQKSPIVEDEVVTNLYSATVPDDERVSEASGDESDEAFKELTEMFAFKSNGKRKVTNKATSIPKRAKKSTVIGPSGAPYTPLEEQVLELKRQYSGVVLFVEVGYKFKFFGEDATIAAKELGMVCFPQRNFLVASIPVHRRDVHMKKLLAQGYKVGIVEQIETAALKKISETRNAPFERKVTHLYTEATYVDQIDSVDNIEKYSPPPIMCLVEEVRGGMGVDERVCIGMVCISPNTGEVLWDEFEDSSMRTELETRIAHVRPAEFLLPATSLSGPSEKMLLHFTNTEKKIRTERFRGNLDYSEAFSFVSEFYTESRQSGFASANLRSGNLLATVTDFPKRVVIALAHAIKHLSAFSIADAFLETEFFSKFTTREHMLLNANTLSNLEIYRNETDKTAKGSLMWILDHTKTKFGARLLNTWVGRPLLDKGILNKRIDAVEEIVSSTSELLTTLRSVIVKLPDLSKGLCRIQYGKCTPEELAILLPAFNKIGLAFAGVERPSDVGLQSDVLNEIIFSLPQLREPMKKLLDSISLKHASQGRKDLLWTDADKYPEIADYDLAIQTVEIELMEELKSVRKILRKPALKWATHMGEEYLVELNKSENHDVPDNWILSSRTRKVERFHTPNTKKKLEERAQHKESLNAAAQKAFSSFLRDISQNYYGIMRDVVNRLATADCLFSFARVALQEGYVRPQFADDERLEITAGRHPVAEALSDQPFVSNSIEMGCGKARNKIITGPNMGGKSSTVRMIALIAIMAQIGSYVPAESVKMGMLDCILTRMGASDDTAKGRSTFMVEMSETSDILHAATPRSLVILDELGRGTSTADGMAVADAVLRHLIQEIRCKTLFITHYPLVAEELEKQHPGDVQNLHMGYMEETRINGTRDITFLYSLAPGMAKESFGIECARLAGLPEPILLTAAERSEHMRILVDNRSRKNRAMKCAQLLKSCLQNGDLGDIPVLRNISSSI